MTSKIDVENKGETWAGSDNVHYDYPGVKYAVPAQSPDRVECGICGDWLWRSCTYRGHGEEGVAWFYAHSSPQRFEYCLGIRLSASVPQPSPSPISPSQPNLASPDGIVDDVER